MQQNPTIDYKIQGSEMQYVELALNPNQAVIGEPTSMMYFENGIQMKTLMGDGSKATSGVFKKLLGMGQRVMSGEDLFMVQFSNIAKDKKSIAFSAPYPGKIIALDLSQLGGTILCQKGVYLCGTHGINIGIAFQKKFSTGLWGGAGFVMQKLQGTTGIVFIHSGGTINEVELQSGETIYVDTGSLVAMQPTVNFSVEMLKGFRNLNFGGEGFHLSKLVGPGRVWLQSLPFHRLQEQISDHTLSLIRKKPKG